MVKKKRLGSDPLDFIQDSRETYKEEKNSELKENSVENDILEESKSNIKKNKSEIIKFHNLKIIIDEINKNKITISFDGDLIINSVEKVREVLSEKLEKYDEIVFILSEINKFDTASFQLLFACKTESRKLNKKVLFLKPSKSVDELYQLYQLESLSLNKNN